MTQPPHGEEPQDPRPTDPGWGRQPDRGPDQPDRQETRPFPPENGWGPPSGAPVQGSGWGPPSGPPDNGWGPPSGPPVQGSGWGRHAGQYGSGQYGGQYGQQYGQQYGEQYGYGQPGGHPPLSQYGAPGQYGPPAGYGRPGQYGAPEGYGQPGEYGQPGQYGGWEQPSPPPRRKRRFGLLFGLLVLALLVGLAFTLPARLGTTRLDPQAVQRDVAAQFQQREGVALDLTCRQQMTVVDGRTYTCDGTTADNDTVTVTITITSNDGDYTWSDS